eukprot:6917140-Pyramimonas_sp.AAC.1
MDIAIDEIRKWDQEGTVDKILELGFLGRVGTEPPKTAYGYPILIVHVKQGDAIYCKIPIYITADHVAATGLHGPHGDNLFD